MVAAVHRSFDLLSNNHTLKISIEHVRFLWFTLLRFYCNTAFVNIRKHKLRKIDPTPDGVSRV